MNNVNGFCRTGRFGRGVTMLAVVGAGLLGVSTGCETSPKAAGVSAPNFNPPVVARTSPSPRTAPTPPPLPPARNYRVAPAPTYAMVNGVPRDWIPRAPANKWLWIVIHHTATPSGALARINMAHKAKGWDEAGYHFVIGNGTESGDGQIEVGPRWPKQKWGAHTKSSDNRFNEHGIGIVMVGNFDLTRPSAAQMQSCAKLVAYLMRTYRVPPERVLGHKQTGRATDCPGAYTNIAAIKQMAVRVLAEAGEEIPSEGKLALDATGAGQPQSGGELLRDDPSDR